MSGFLWVFGFVLLYFGLVCYSLSGEDKARSGAHALHWIGAGSALAIAGALCWRFA